LDLIAMSGRELHRIEVLSEVVAKKRIERPAAAVLGISTRQTRRLLTAYRDSGGSALIHKARGRASNDHLVAGAAAPPEGHHNATALPAGRFERSTQALRQSCRGRSTGS